jgi:hypothetical protein
MAAPSPLGCHLPRWPGRCGRNTLVHKGIRNEPPRDGDVSGARSARFRGGEPWHRTAGHPRRLGPAAVSGRRDNRSGSPLGKAIAPGALSTGCWTRTAWSLDPRTPQLIRSHDGHRWSSRRG